MHVQQQTPTRLELYEQTLRILLPVWVLTISGIVVAFRLSLPYQPILTEVLGLLGSCGIYGLFKIERTELCILDTEQNILMLKERWLFGLRVHTYPLQDVVNVEVAQVSAKMYQLAFRLCSGGEVPLFVADRRSTYELANCIGEFLFP